MHVDRSPLGAVRSLVEAVNRGDMARVPAMFGPSPVIIEDIAPFRWDGPDAPGKWLKAMGVNAAATGMASIDMELGSPIQLASDADKAYIAIPGHLLMEGDGNRLEADGLLAFTLSLVDEEWLIDTLVWSGPAPLAVGSSGSKTNR